MNCISLVLVLLLVSATTESDFSYTVQNPEYIVGNEIVANLPQIEVDGGTFTVKPRLSKGLSLDALTGEIKGNPTEEYQATFTITYTKPDESKLTSVLDIKIWDKPQVLTCGFTKMDIVYSLTDSFQCRSDKKVKSWSVSFDPEGVYNIAISNDGVLQFNKYNPIEKLTIKVKASNPASDEVTPTQIVISKKAFEYKSGLNIDVNDVNEFYCGSGEIHTVYYSLSTIIDNLDGLDVKNAYDIWDTKLNVFLSSNNVKFWNFTIEGFIYADLDGEYSFETNSDYASYEVYIDDENAFTSDDFSYSEEDWFGDVVDYHGYCSLWDYSEKSHKVTLTAGYHPFKMIGFYSQNQINCHFEELWDGSEEEYCSYTYTDSTYKLKFMWIKPGNNYEDRIQFYQKQLPYKPVIYLTFDSDYYTVPVNTYFEIPFKFKRGKATECAGPPATITFDLSRNIMKGTFGFTFGMPINVFCRTTTSTTNTFSLTIKGVNQYVKGIVGYYLKSDNFDDSCLTPYTPSSDNVNTEMIRLEDGINHQYESEYYLWDGLTPNFMSEFGVNWEGYLKIDIADNYTFNLSSVQASWLSIDYVEIINRKGINEWGSVNKTINLSVGYHFIRVNYMKYIGASGIELTMRQGENGEFKVLNDYLYFIPRGDFEYSTSYAVYIKDKKIDNNIPRIHEGGGSISECTSNPSLPSDLELTADCTIRGTPKVESDRQSYTITGKMSDGKAASATIQISVIGSITPQGIHLVDLDSIGIIYTDSLNLFLGNETHLSIEVDSGYALYYEFENTPEGFDLNTFKGTLTIIAREFLSNYELIIKAYYDKNENPISKTILVNVTNGCLGVGEQVVFFKVDNDLNPRERDLDYEYYDEDYDSIVELTIPPGPVPLYSQSLCLVPGNYYLEFVDYYAEYVGGYNYISLYSDGRLVDYMILKNGGYEEFTINTELKGPTVDYGKIKTVYYLNDIILLIPQTKLLERCEISPELPSCLSFNTSTCAITGKATEYLQETQYTITAIGLYLRTTKHLNLTLYNETISSICNKQYKAMISVYLLSNKAQYANPDDFIYRLYRTSEYDFDNRTALIELKGSKEGWVEDAEYEYYYCLEEDEYTSEYENIDSSNKGFKSSYFDISVNDIPVTRKSLDKSESEATNHFNAIFDYTYKTEWEYSTRYEDGWDEIDKASGLWDKTKLPEIENVAGNAVYIRKIDTFTNLDQYSAFSLKVRYISGIIIKINGKEIFRDNLPKGEITPSTMADTMYNALIDKVFLLPLDWFTEEKVIITIELHKHENEKNFPQIISTLLKMIGSEGECLILNKFARPITETNTEASEGYEIRLGLDEISYTECYTSLGWTIMRFKEGINAYFNQFSIYTYEALKNYPEDFSIEGYNSNNNTWNTIVKYKGIEFPENKKRVFTNYAMSNMYNAIRINMTGYNENSSHIDIYDFNFHLCPFRYCKAVDDLLPDTPTGTEVKVSCKDPSIPGERLFYCGNDKKWEEVNTTCEEEPTILFQETEYTFKAGSSYKDISLFKISGKNVSYSMNPIIEGLEIDKKTGLISGKPYKEQNEQFIYFLLSSPFSPNPVTIEIKIIVLPSERPILIWINDTIKLDSGKNYKDLRLFYVTGVDLTYSVDVLPSGLHLDKKTGLINGMTIEESSTKCTIMTKNQYELEFALLINVEFPFKPNNIKYEKEVSVIFGVDYIDLQPYKCVAKTLLYTVSPELPDGLVLNRDTGSISGKVNVEPPSSETYIFNCSNYFDEIPNPITIHIEESVEPVIINHIDNIIIEGGKDYEGIILGRVTGKNLLYKITPSLPSATLKLNTSSGTISGYISEKFDSINLTMIISGSGKQVSYSFMMGSSIPDYPVIVPSTKVSNITFDFSQPIKNVFLFVAVGTNIFISVKPELPEGLTLVHETGEIYGIPVKYVEEAKYVFSITNIPSPVIETVEVDIKFNAIYCEADSGFPRTPAEKGGREVSIKCGGANTGMKRRKCLLTDGNKAVWSKIDDSDCKISSGAIAGIAVGSVAVGLIIIVVIVFCLLRTGIFRKRARSQSQLHKIIVDPQNKDETANNDQDKGIRI